MPTRYTDNVRCNGAEPIVWKAVTAAQTLVKGDFVTLVAAGTVSEAAADSAALYGRMKAYDDYKEKACIVLAVPGVQYQVKANAAVSDALVGDMIDLAVDGTSGEHLADVNGVGSASVKIFRIAAIVDATARQILVEVPDAKSQAVDVEVNA